MIGISCQHNNTERKPIRLVMLDPGHFHAALVQKTMYEDVDTVVHVYAPGGSDLQLHMDRLKAYNNRKTDPTRWNEVVITGPDFFEKMIAEKKGNVVVLSGNNQKKAGYILTSLQNGFHVYADKPMAIDTSGFEKLKEAFAVARQNNLLLYDIMTERYEITSILQRELSMMPELFGNLQQGTPEDPGVVMQSTHHFHKSVSGNVLTRPSWFFDATQQGEAIADVMTHLVDLVQWVCFPGEIIDYTRDIQFSSAKHWTTSLDLNAFKAITRSDSFPSFLRKNVDRDSILKILFNGEISYRLKGIHVRTSALWNYKAPEGAGDSHYSLMKGSKANLVVKQGAEEDYLPVLYIEPVDKNLDPAVAFARLQLKYPGLELKRLAASWEVIIPATYKEGHEEHFAKVTRQFLDYIKNKNMPDWEVPNMLAKYFVTTKAREIASVRSSLLSNNKNSDE